MAVYKCKMCGAKLEIQEGCTVAECGFCGTSQTVPTATSEQVQILFNRANILRLKNEFDKAEQLYEKIIQLDDTQAEAYWGLILCKFGIEYVEDPATLKRIPTCHRTLLDSVIADDDYKSALQCADFSQRVIYEAEAIEIDRLQKEALALSQTEEPYDVFICYKETDDSGKRTQDSVIANDIYHQLTQEGFKVFYAAITLEDKLGSAYEPYIFAALQSAKVMLVIGTNAEYFTAVWVKNEWSRYLKMMKSDRKKMLIPCYRDMDAYDLPEEFAHLQAQDMSKIGFMHDLIRGIKKVIVKEDSTPKPTAQTTSGNSQNVASLLKRVFFFLEDSDWDNADAYCEKVLDIDPECATAYIGKLLAAKKHSTVEALIDAVPFVENELYFKKAMRFADSTYQNELEMLLAAKRRNQEKEFHNNDGTYHFAKNEIPRSDPKETARTDNFDFASFFNKSSDPVQTDNKNTFSTQQSKSILTTPQQDANIEKVHLEVRKYLADESNKKEIAGLYEELGRSPFRANDVNILAYYLEATMHMNNENYEEEFIVLSRALELDPQCAATLNKLGRCCRAQGQNSQALQYYKDAIAINPNEGVAYTNIGIIHLLNHKWSEAVQYYEKGLPLINMKTSDYWTAYANYAVAVAKLGNPDKAKKMIKDAESHGYPNGKAIREQAGIKDDGCYIATAVYGSYDCPQVWTLRRFRDNTLAKTWYGRTFIRTYYATSPTLVAWFGQTNWFKALWKGKLDRMVASLQAKGFESTPYEDTQWRS